jgi:hypothetical protein
VRRIAPKMLAGTCSSAATHTSPVALEQVSARFLFVVAVSSRRRGQGRPRRLPGPSSRARPPDRLAESRPTRPVEDTAVTAAL